MPRVLCPGPRHSGVLMAAESSLCGDSYAFLSACRWSRDSRGTDTYPELYLDTPLLLDTSFGAPVLYVTSLPAGSFLNTSVSYLVEFSLFCRMLSRKLGQQLGRPTLSLSGWLISKFLKKHNQILEENAVKLCEIQPDETVLELGYGPGLGLQEAVHLLTGSRGKLLGVDYSTYMHQMATERMQEHIACGKVDLYCCDVAAMPLEDSSVDKVFHCNCYYFWPDLKAAASEIHRVMKPGGLMVTTLRLDRITSLASKKVFPGDNWRPEAYMEALQSCGFADVQIENKTEKRIPFQAIYATAAK